MPECSIAIGWPRSAAISFLKSPGCSNVKRANQWNSTKPKIIRAKKNGRRNGGVSQSRRSTLLLISNPLIKTHWREISGNPSSVSVGIVFALVTPPCSRRASVLQREVCVKSTAGGHISQFRYNRALFGLILKFTDFVEGGDHVFFPVDPGKSRREHNDLSVVDRRHIAGRRYP